jgi:hypothetical protein
MKSLFLNHISSIMLVAAWNFADALAFVVAD